MVVEQELVSLQEREEKLEEQGQQHPRPEDQSVCAPLEAVEVLETLKVELNSANERDNRASLWLRQKDPQRRKGPLFRRSTII